MPLDAPSSVPSDLVPVDAVFGVRVFAGSREALLRAALDLVDLSQGLTVRSRSLVWRECDPPHGLCAALGVESHHPIDSLAAGLKALAARLNAPVVPGGRPAMLLELLWAHEQRGPAPAPPPATGPATPLPRDMSVREAMLMQPPPPMRPGRSVVHPAVLTEAWAAGPLSEVAPEAQDPKTGRFLRERLYDMTTHLIEDPRPFRAAFPREDREVEHRRFCTVSAATRADALVAVAEVVGQASPCGQPVGPDTVFPEEAWPVSLVWPDDVTPAVRFKAWSDAVHATLVKARGQLRRAVVLDDGPRAVSGWLFGAHHEGPFVPLPHQDVQVHPQRGDTWEATLSYAVRTGKP